MCFMKKVVKILLVLFALLIVALVVAFFSLDRIVKKGVETVGPSVAKVDVKLNNAKLSPFSGSGELKGLIVGNPPGFKTPSAIQVGSVGVKVDPGSVMSDKIVVRSVNVKAPEITFEGGPGGNNLSKILENVQGTEEKPPATKEEHKGTTKKLQVDDFVISGGKIHVSATMLGGKAATMPLPEIHLTNLGQGPEGITPAELTKRVLKEILDGTLKSVSTGVGTMGKEALESVKGAGTGTVEKATKGIGDLFKKKQ